MKKQDVLSILITFSMGVVAGIYIYFTGFTVILFSITASDEERANRFVVQAESYGSCGSNCPSFQVKADGSYRYLFVPEVGQAEVLREGELTRGTRNALRRSLNDISLERQSENVESIDCLSQGEGIDVTYEITLDENNYVLDSCGTAVDWDGSIWLALNEVWVELGQTGNN
tara:strand:- start:816 stop:1331 length:516 start_codon:yes stop_codon:yes gene_type:complete